MRFMIAGGIALQTWSFSGHITAAAAAEVCALPLSAHRARTSQSRRPALFLQILQHHGPRCMRAVDAITKAQSNQELVSLVREAAQRDFLQGQVSNGPGCWLRQALVIHDTVEIGVVVRGESRHGDSSYRRSRCEFSPGALSIQKCPFLLRCCTSSRIKPS